MNDREREHCGLVLSPTDGDRYGTTHDALTVCAPHGESASPDSIVLGPDSPDSRSREYQLSPVATSLCTFSI